MFAEINGVQVAYDDSGSGVPVVFIHGFPLNRTLWDPQRPLASAHRLITLDLPGHGESGPPAGPVTMDSFADAVRGLLDTLAIERAVIAGLSMGGYVTYAFYRRYPERVRALIVANTRAVADSPEAASGRRALAQAVLAQGPDPVIAAMFAKMFAGGEVSPTLGPAVRAMMVGTPPTVIAADLEALASRPDSTPTLRAIRVPALVIHGDQDVLIPPSEATYQSDRIPGARLVVIEGAGHLSNLEAPEAFNAAVREFLASVEG